MREREERENELGGWFRCTDIGVDSYVERCGWIYRWMDGCIVLGMSVCYGHVFIYICTCITMYMYMYMYLYTRNGKTIVDKGMDR